MSEGPELQMRVVGLPADQAQVNSTVLNLIHHNHAVGDVGANLDAGIPLMEDRKQSGQQMFSRYGARPQQEFTRNGGLLSRDFLARFTVQVENSLSVAVESLTRFRKKHTTTLTTEQGHTERLFQELDSLADGRLS